MLEVSASVELSGLSRFRSRPCCLPPRLTASALHSKRFRSSILSPHVPLSNASGPALRRVPHDSGSGWFATPFLCDSFIHYSMPVFTSAPDDRLMSSASVYPKAAHLRHLRQSPRIKNVRFLVAGSIGIGNVLSNLGASASMNDFQHLKLQPFTDPVADGFLKALSESHDVRLPAA